MLESELGDHVAMRLGHRIDRYIERVEMLLRGLDDAGLQVFARAHVEYLHFHPEDLRRRFDLFTLPR